MRYAPAVIVGRSVRALARLRKPGGGSAVPGLVVNLLAPGYLAHALNSFPGGLVIISGSSGKSTTTKMLVAALRAHGRSVFTNSSTANISQGLTSALLEDADLNGRIDRDIAVLEMDEGHGALIAPKLSPRVVALTNVMVDQIDRFFDPEMVAGMLARIADRATGSVIVNADDGHLAELSSALKDSVDVVRYGVSDGVLAGAVHGLGHARLAERRIQADEGVLVSAVDGRLVRLEVDGGVHIVSLPARGVHYATDAAASLATAKAVLGRHFDAAVACAAIGAIPPVFGRGEVVTVRGQNVEFVLVQNPASYQLNIDTVDPDAPKLFAMGSDVRDPSYFWPVETAHLRSVDIVSGSKADELALQLAYDGVVIGHVVYDLGHAVDAFLAEPVPARGMKTIIFSADSMRRVRAHLGLPADGDSAW